MGSITGNTNGSSSDKGLIEPINITMSVTSSISKDGNLNNLTSNFSQVNIPLKDLTLTSSNSPQIGHLCLIKTLWKLIPLKEI